MREARAPAANGSATGAATPADGGAEGETPAGRGAEGALFIGPISPGAVAVATKGAAAAPAAAAPNVPLPPSQAAALRAANDPNNIFSALTKRMGTLEINQTLINTWISLWEVQISAKLKNLSAMQNATHTKLRSVQANVSASQERMSNLTSSLGIERIEQVALQHAEARPPPPPSPLALPTLPPALSPPPLCLLSYPPLSPPARAAQVLMLRDNVSTVEAQLLQLLARSEGDAAELRRELRAAARGHRVELLCCTLLSLALSWLVAAKCIWEGRNAPRRPDGRWIQAGRAMRERERERERVSVSASASCSDLPATVPSPQAAGAVAASPDSVTQLRKRLARSNGARAACPRAACPSSRSMPSLPQQKLPQPPPFDSAAARRVHANGCSAVSEGDPLALGTGRNGLPLESRSQSEMSLESHPSL